MESIIRNNEKKYEYILRAHHGMCLAFFKGKGYSSEFVSGMGYIKKKMEDNPTVCIVAEADAICAGCPNNMEGQCKTAELVKEYDRQVLVRCGISEGDVMTFNKFKKLVYDNILIAGKREEICGKCQWNSLCSFKD